MANVTWVVPSAANSDHDGLEKDRPIVGGDGGQLGDDQSVLAFNDDLRDLGRLGGWYDHVPPPQLDALGLGFRVPLIAISPRAKTNYVSHVQYESASILTYVEHQFGLAPIGPADARAGDLSDLFLPAGQFSKQRSRRLRIPQPYSDAEVLRAARDDPFEPDED